MGNPVNEEGHSEHAKTTTTTTTTKHFPPGNEERHSEHTTTTKDRYSSFSSLQPRLCLKMILLDANVSSRSCLKPDRWSTYHTCSWILCFCSYFLGFFIHEYGTLTACWRGHPRKKIGAQSLLSFRVEAVWNFGRQIFNLWGVANDRKVSFWDLAVEIWNLSTHLTRSLCVSFPPKWHQFLLNLDPSDFLPTKRIMESICFVVSLDLTQSANGIWERIWRGRRGGNGDHLILVFRIPLLREEGLLIQLHAQVDKPKVLLSLAIIFSLSIH